MHFTQLLSVRNNYCIKYQGNDESYVKTMNNLRPRLESQYLDINIFFVCNDRLMYLLDSNPKNVPLSKFNKNDYLHVYEVLENPKGENLNIA